VRSLSDEARVFLRMSLFGLITGGAYWFLTYEQAGTVLLVAFGLASGLAAMAIFVGSRRGGSGLVAGLVHDGVPAAEAKEPAAPEAPEAELLPEAQPPSETEPLPQPGWAPLGIAAGIGAVALGAAFGPWLTLAGVLVAILGAWTWLSAAMREIDAVRGRRPPD
jgi:hypothetical protein